MPRTIKAEDVTDRIRDVRRELRAVQTAVDERKTDEAYAAAERAQDAAFELKALFQIHP